MKILILAVGRSGGYRLSQWLSMEFGYTHVHEPKYRNYIANDNEVVKELIYYKPHNITQYDKVIGLIRENVEEVAVSQLRGMKTNKWHENYIVTNNWLNDNQNEINETKLDILKLNDMVLNDRDIQLHVTYEKIYNSKEDIEKLKDFLNIKEFNHLNHIDNKYKYRSNKLI